MCVGVLKDLIEWGEYFLGHGECERGGKERKRLAGEDVVFMVVSAYGFQVKVASRRTNIATGD